MIQQSWVVSGGRCQATRDRQDARSRYANVDTTYLRPHVEH